MDVIPVEYPVPSQETSLELCRQLEHGHILMLAKTPFMPSEEDCEFLRAQRQSESKAHKNIAYKPHLDRATGTTGQAAEDGERLHRILAQYSRGALAFLGEMFPNYARVWKVDYASFRPVEEEGRVLPLRHRNDLMHLDAFPTRPTHGGRILRAFTNLHPTKDRVWGTSDSFEALAERYAEAAGLKQVTSPLSAARRRAARAGRLVGLKVPARSPYDEFMLNFHHFLKSNEAFQKTGRRHTFAFPPGATWICFTDQIGHSVLSGQYALEQTCIVPYEAMVQPELSPIAVLERLAGRPLTDSREAGRIPA
ncbi:MAG TPA: Kdo hydroxylase family protein [Chthonomonadaceae bacterium]|nr:Kdo hydroxylase family protein [Chthonomonadaceae bacterium]